MSSQLLTAIISFLDEKQWKHVKTYKQYSHYKAPDSLEMEDYILTIPSSAPKEASNRRKKLFKTSIKKVIEILSDIYKQDSTIKELLDDLILLSNKSILAFRIIDNQTTMGTIPFNRLEEFFKRLKNVLIQTIAFVTTDEQIFAQNNAATEFYLNQANVLQSEEGSYVTKIEVPNKINTLDSLFEDYPEKVNDRIIDILDFLTNDLIKIPTTELSNSFILQNSKLINADVFDAIVKLYEKSKISNAEISLIHPRHQKRTVQLKNISKNIIYYKNHYKIIKDILLQDTKLDAQGYVYKLERTRRDGKVGIKSLISNKKEEISCHLNSDYYQLAIQAHERELTVRIKGTARTTKKGYTIDKVELFEIISK